MRAIRRPGFLLLLLALPGSASARAGDDSFRLDAGLGGHYDDNVLRVPHNEFDSDSNSDSDSGFGGQRGDSWRQFDGGIGMAS